jgi:hypothetical protein
MFIDKHGVYDNIIFLDDIQKTFGEKINLYHFVKKYETC